MRRILPLLLLALVCPARPALAAWGADGGAVTTAAQAQNQPALAPDASGGVFFGWIDARSGFNSDLYAVRWSNAGATLPGWLNGGSNVTAVTCAKSNPVAISDGVSGALFAWEDNRCTGFTNIYAIRVLASGPTGAGWPTNGTRLAATTSNQVAPAICSDAAGGAFITWQDMRSPEGDIYLQHLDGAGVVVAGWPATGLAIASGAAIQSAPAIAPDGAGGVFVAWQDRRAGNDDVYLQHVTAGGTLAAGFVANGNAVCAAVGDQRAPAMASDGAGGVVLAWQDRRSGGFDVYAARVGGTGVLAAGFAADGNAVCVAAGDQTNVRVVGDGANGLVAAWQDRRGADSDVYAARVTAAGVLAAGWTADGTVVTSSSGDQTNPVLATDGAGGAYLAWEDRRGLNADVYALRLASDGSTPSGWSTNGALLCGAALDQTAPRITAATGGGAYVIWNDARNTATTAADLYAQHLLANGPEQVRPSNLAATHHDGQTFLTFDPPPATGWTHRVYYSPTPIATDADLVSATLLGSVGDSSATDQRLESLLKILRTYRTDSTATPLSPEKGLFVVTVPASRTGWYAVTSQLAGSPEDRHVVPGGNALTTGVTELLARPRPVYQGTLTLSPITADIYTLWTSAVDTPLWPAMSNRTSQPFDCSVTHGAPQGVAFVRAHAYGSNFLSGFQASGNSAEWVLSLDDYTNNADLATWWYGYHPSYNTSSNVNPVPITGTIVDYTNRRCIATIQWARATFNLDTTRMYAFGFSLGGTYSMQLAFRHPELVAATMASTGKADYSFLSEPVVNSGYNATGQYRPIVNRLWGTVATNLPSSEGLPMYTLMNDDSLAALTEAQGAVFNANFSGRHDETVGWKEKLAYWESMRVHRQGHVEFWDNRDHSGFIFPGGMAPNLDLRYLYRFRSNLSWPAFSNCSADNVVGDGTAASGDSLGTINGYMDWDPAVADSANGWAVTLSTRGLATLWGPLAAPESLTVDVTPRRLQAFHPAVGTTINWTAKRSSDNALVQSGTVTVDALGLITVPAVKVYRSGTKLVLGVQPTGLGVGPRAPGGLAFGRFENPIRGLAHLSIEWPESGPASVELYDVHGRRVAVLFDGTVVAGARRLDADFAGAAPGLYLMRARQGGHEATRRVITLR